MPSAPKRWIVPISVGSCVSISIYAKCNIGRQTINTLQLYCAAVGAVVEATAVDVEIDCGVLSFATAVTITVRVAEPVRP